MQPFEIGHSAQNPAQMRCVRHVTVGRSHQEEQRQTQHDGKKISRANRQHKPNVDLAVRGQDGKSRDQPANTSGSTYHRSRKSSRYQAQQRLHQAAEDAAKKIQLDEVPSPEQSFQRAASCKNWNVMNCQMKPRFNPSRLNAP